MAVVGSVSAIVAAYRDGSEYILAIKQRHESQASPAPLAEDSPSHDLELSMARGQDVIRSQYERDFKRLGAPFATGDQVARDTLMNILIPLQKHVVSELKRAWEDNTLVDYYLLQDVSDESQDRSIMCLMQLHQRLLVAAPIDMVSGTARPPSNYFARNYSSRAGTSQRYILQQPPSETRRPTSGDHAVIPVPEMEAPRSRFVPQFRHDNQYDGVASRFQHMNAVAADYVSPDRPMDRDRYSDSRGESPYDEHPRQDYFRQPAQQDRFRGGQQSAQPPKPFARGDRFHPDSPTTMGPVRLSTVGTVSSNDSEDHPEYNPWAANGGVENSNTSIQGSTSPVSYYRQRESQDSFRSRQTSATLWNPRGDSFADSCEDKVHSKAWGPGDYESDYSRDSRVSHYLDYFEQPGQGPVTKIISAADSLEDRFESRTPHRPSTSSQNTATYTWKPPYQRNLSPPLLGMTSSPPSQVGPMQRMPSVPDMHRNPSRPGLHEGPPPTAPPSRPIPIPNGPPRIPERAPNRPPVPLLHSDIPPAPRFPPRRVPSDASPSVASRSPLTPMTPSTPMTPPTPRMPIVTSKPLNPTASTTMSFQSLPIRPGSTSTQSTTNRPAVRVQPALQVIPAASGAGQKAWLPSEANKYAGFCKGAWRAQIGDKKKTYEERNRPGTMYTKMNTFYKCQKCNFEGRAIKPPGAKKSTIDTKVYGSNGVLYRWEFLFKSHVHCKTVLSTPLDSHFGCVFCCAEGKGTPIFGGVASLLAHLQEHRDVLPEGEVVYRMHTVVGRSPDPDEEFDVALPALVI